MKITVDNDKSCFLASQDGVDMGFASFFFQGEDRMVIDHVIVEPEFRGRDIGKQLVFAAVDFARKNGIKITPWCSYARKLFDRHSEISDVL